MARAPHHARSGHHGGAVGPDPVETSEEVPQLGGTAFRWSPAKIRIASFILLAAAAPAAAGFLVPVLFVKWLCVAWLAGVAYLMHGLGRRASAESVVLSVDQRGILDRRLMPKPMAWQEIEGLCPVDVDRNHVVDITLRWPKTTLAGTRWPVRVGAYCQMAYGVPAVSISMLLLDGTVRDVLDAVARYRPDLLHCTNRTGLSDA